MTAEAVAQLIASRRQSANTRIPSGQKVEAEGGCGVVGLASSVPVLGKHILAPCGQMHNRGNGKGGGLSAAGLIPSQMRVSADQLRTDYLIQIALLDPDARAAITQEFIDPVFEVHAGYRIDTVDEYRDIDGLEVKPPDVWRYFARVKPDVLDRFVSERTLGAVGAQDAEDECVSQWAFQLNSALYAGGKMQAFVMSYGRDMLVLKIVGFAEQAFRYYKMDEIQARVWIGHQRYPTKGRVWHPGGAHPFAALDVALVHNGDFANYHAVSEYLAQRNFFPLFLTDTEVAVLLFDLWGRTYKYPLEYLIEAMAPTTERDFRMLPEEKQRIYRAIQTAHIHGSPDGPWFFIITRTMPNREGWQLIGITDTSMLRPQVFALQEGDASVGIIASEKQAIDATLASLAQDDVRVSPVADRYWNARGGSYTDGGAFIFTVNEHGRLTCTNKFGEIVGTPPGQEHYVPLIEVTRAARTGGAPRPVQGGAPSPRMDDKGLLLEQGQEALKLWPFDALALWLAELRREARLDDGARSVTLDVLTHLIDRRGATGTKKRSSVLAMLHTALYGVLRDVPMGEQASRYVRIDWAQRRGLRPPAASGQTLIVDAYDFPSEGDDSAARFLVQAYHIGWKSFIVFALRGQRFIGNGFGAHSAGVRIDAYGSSGDYLGSGLDGVEIRVHNDAQDQVGQILKAGKLIIHGNVGQTLLYGAKGGDIYILGSAAGRPLINAVGRPRVVINGTALDYLAESFMAGDPHDRGGFCILNGVAFDAGGSVIDLETPYPGGNLFSLASGGAIYARDPYGRLDEEQLNGGRYTELTDADWRLMTPYLEENERLFGIPVERLLTVDGRRREPKDVYRKVEPIELAVLK